MTKIIDFKNREEFDEEKNKRIMDLWEQYLDWERANRINMMNEYQDAENIIKESNLVIFKRKVIN